MLYADRQNDAGESGSGHLAVWHISEKLSGDQEQKPADSCRTFMLKQVIVKQVVAVSTKSRFGSKSVLARLLI